MSEASTNETPDVIRTLNYSSSRAPSILLPIAATISAIYPVLYLISLYRQWLLSWYMIGRRPIGIMEDPKSIDGASWMMGITGPLLLGLLPACCWLWS